jgi:hypothetical protein
MPAIPAALSSGAAMPDDTIREAWTAFRDMTIARDASAEQLEEMERAFFAGALTLYAAVLHVGRKDVSEDTGELLLASIGRELEAYAVAMLQAVKQ